MQTAAVPWSARLASSMLRSPLSPPEFVDFFLLTNDLRLLLFDRIDQEHIDAVVRHTFDFTFIVVDDQQRLDRGHFFGCQ
jgi:hypothetical protein